jgi:hypothetical protein
LALENKYGNNILIRQQTMLLPIELNFLNTNIFNEKLTYMECTTVFDED